MEGEENEKEEEGKGQKKKKPSEPYLTINEVYEREKMRSCQENRIRFPEDFRRELDELRTKGGIDERIER